MNIYLRFENACRLIISRKRTLYSLILGAMSCQTSNLFSVNQQSNQQVFTE